MRILHTYQEYNLYSGSRAVRLLSEELARRGHEVVVATGGPERKSEDVNGVRVERFPFSGNAVEGINGEKKHKQEYRDLLRSSQFDVMLNYAAQSWPTDLAFEVLDSIEAKKIFVPCGYSRLRNKRYVTYYRDLPAMLKKYDHLIYLSREYQDKRFGDDHGIHDEVRYSIISNGADAKEFAGDPSVDIRLKYGISTEHMVVTVANHYFAKDHPLWWRAVNSIKRDDVTFLLFGRKHAQWWRSCYPYCATQNFLSKNVRMISDAPREVVVSALKAADLMLHTSRIECDPIVMYEAFASHTPMVATPAGSIPEFAPLVSVQKNSPDLVAGLNGLLDDPVERDRRAHAAHQLWEREHRLSRMFDRYELLYKDVCSGS